MLHIHGMNPIAFQWNRRLVALIKIIFTTFKVNGIELTHPPLPYATYLLANIRPNRIVLNGIWQTAKWEKALPAIQNAAFVKFSVSHDLLFLTEHQQNVEISVLINADDQFRNYIKVRKLTREPFYLKLDS